LGATEINLEFQYYLLWTPNKHYLYTTASEFGSQAKHTGGTLCWTQLYHWLYLRLQEEKDHS